MRARQSPPASTMPAPTPANTVLVRPTRPSEARRSRHHADTLIRTHALATPAIARSTSHQTEAALEAHGERGEADGDEPRADRAGRAHAQPHHGQSAQQVADVVRGREPPAHRDREAGVLVHHRQDRREGEAPDAHAHGERAGLRRQPRRPRPTRSATSGAVAVGRRGEQIGRPEPARLRVGAEKLKPAAFA